MSEGNEQLQFQSTYIRESGAVEDLIGKGELWEGSLSQAVMDVHDGTNRRNLNGEVILGTGSPPKIIFFTATAGSTYAIAIKECWRTAYPNEVAPKFFLIDASKKRLVLDINPQELIEEEIEQVKAAEIERLKSIGEKYKALKNTAVLDEIRNSGSTLGEVDRQLAAAGFDNVNFILGHWGKTRTYLGVPPEARSFARKKISYSQFYPQFFPDEEKTGRHVAVGFQTNQESREVVADMKIIGRLMGQEILRHLSI